MSGPPRTRRGGVARHSRTGAPVTETLKINPHTARSWWVSFPAGSTVTLTLPPASYVPGLGGHLKVVNDGAAPVTIELVGGPTPETLSLPVDRVVHLFTAPDPDYVALPGESAGSVPRWYGMVFFVGVRAV